MENNRKTNGMKKGFTLVELLFVMAIISILAGIGISQMSSSTDTAEKTAAKGNIRNVITEAQLFYATNQTYAGFTSTNGKVTVATAVAGGFCVETTANDAAATTYRYDSTTDSAVAEGQVCP